MKLRRSIFNGFTDFPIEIPTVGTNENVKMFKEIEILDFKLLGAQEESESVLGRNTGSISRMLDRLRTFLGP